MSDLSNTIYILFNRPWDIEQSYDEEEQTDALAQSIIDSFGWTYVYTELKKYLIQYCTTAAQAINAAHIFWQLGWEEYPIPDCYRFLGFFYYRINFETPKYDDMDILDSLVTTILPKAGFSVADLYNNPHYMPETDPEIINAVNYWKEYFKK